MLPSELVDVATSLNHVVGHTVDREDLLVAWLVHLDRRLDDLAAPDGRAVVGAAVRERSATIGRDVRVELPGGGEVVGRAIDISEAGRLVVAPDGGGDVVEVTVGDIVHLRHRA